MDGDTYRKTSNRDRSGRREPLKRLSSGTKAIRLPVGECVKPSSKNRASMACTRCRSRKIRCSGDPGNDLGCEPCRRQTSDVGPCIFARVRSSPVLFNDGHGIMDQSGLDPVVRGSGGDRRPVSGIVSNPVSMAPVYTPGSTTATSGNNHHSAAYNMYGQPVLATQGTQYGNEAGFHDPASPSMYGPNAMLSMPEFQVGSFRQAHPSHERLFPTENMRFTAPQSNQSALPSIGRRLPVPNPQGAPGTTHVKDLRKSLGFVPDTRTYDATWSSRLAPVARRQSTIHDLAHVSSFAETNHL